jgi:hypothetical protein
MKHRNARGRGKARPHDGARMKRPASPSAAERILDRAIELTFPASDPIAVEHAYRSARARDQSGVSTSRRRRAKRRRQEP